MLSHEKGFTLIELLITLAIMGILAGVGIPQYLALKVRAYNIDAESSLKNTFLNCRALWIDQGSETECNRQSLSGGPYSFKPSGKVILSFEAGRESNFHAQARHLDSPDVFVIDLNGKITQLGKEAQLMLPVASDAVTSTPPTQEGNKKNQGNKNKEKKIPPGLEKKEENQPATAKNNKS